MTSYSCLISTLIINHVIIKVDWMSFWWENFGFVYTISILLSYRLLPSQVVISGWRPICFLSFRNPCPFLGIKEMVPKTEKHTCEIFNVFRVTIHKFVTFLSVLCSVASMSKTLRLTAFFKFAYTYQLTLVLHNWWTWNSKTFRGCLIMIYSICKLDLNAGKITKPYLWVV